MGDYVLPYASLTLTKTELERKCLCNDENIEYFKNKEGKNVLWCNYLKIKYNGIEQPFVKCAYCNNILSYKAKTGTGSLQRHKCPKSLNITPSSTSYVQPSMKVDKTQPKKIPIGILQNIHEQQLSFISKDLRPLDITNGDGFLEIAQTLINVGASYGPHQITEVLCSQKRLANILPNIYENIKTELSSMIHKYKTAYTCDLWKNNTHHYLTLTSHFIDDTYKLNTYILGTRLFPEEQTGVNIRGFILKILGEFTDANDKISESIIITDNTSKMISAFSPYFRLTSMCHNINLIMESVFDFKMNLIKTEDVESKNEINNIINSSKSLLKFMYTSGLNNFLKKPLKEESCTFWSEIYFMLNNIFESFEEIENILSETNQLHVLAGLNLSSLESIVTFCKIFIQCSENLGSDIKPTINEIVLWKKKLLHFCAVNNNDTNLLKILKSRAVKYLIKYFHIHSIYNVALFLDCNLKSLSFFEDIEKEEILSDVKTMLTDLYEETENQKSSPKKIAFDNEIYKDFLDNSSNIDIKPIDVILDNEIKSYMAKIIFNQCDILEFWKIHKDEFPYLSTLARRVLNIPASCASSERCFSATTKLLEQRRRHISSENMDKILFLNKNWKSVQQASVARFETEESSL